jgi:NADPH:quinone reductase-like Zn-dependent oxidoreductase
MRAVVLLPEPAPDVLRLVEHPDPRLGPDEVLLEVRAASLGAVDLPALRDPDLPRPRIPGAQAAGVVRRLGEQVSAGPAAPFGVGDEVLVYPRVGCGTCPACAAERVGDCAGVVALGQGRDGGWAQYLAVPTRSLLHKPAGLTFEEAACLLLDDLPLAEARAALEAGRLASPLDRALHLSQAEAGRQALAAADVGGRIALVPPRLEA